MATERDESTDGGKVEEDDCVGMKDEMIVANMVTGWRGSAVWEAVP